jgi:hypothetical protein
VRKCPVDIRVYDNPNATHCIRCLECTDCECVSLTHVFKSTGEEQNPITEEVT